MVAVPLLRRHVEDRIPRRLPDDRHQGVEAAKLALGALDDLLRLGVVEHVAYDGRGGLAEVGDGGGDAVGPLFDEVGDGDAAAGAGEEFRRALAHALAAAHDERRLSFELQQ